jgi:hypothetical protein
MNNQLLEEIPQNNSLQVAHHTADLLPPELDQFELDLNEGILDLFWNEAVDSAVLFSHISFVDSTTNSTFFTLNGGNATQTGTNSIKVTLTTSDLNLVFADTTLATAMDNTYIYLEMNVLSDIHLNPNAPQGPIQVDDYRQDITQPRLERYDLDLNVGLVTLVFSETVNASVLRPEEITFQDQEQNPFSFYSLTGGNPIPTVSPTAMFDLSIDDLNGIKALPDLAISNETTFIAFGADLIVDMSDNRVESVPSREALAVSIYMEDTIPPSLLFFNFELDAGVLTLSFDETVNVTSLDITALLLQNHATSPSSSYRLNDSTVGLSHSSELNISLSISDLNNIKDVRDLCSSDSADDCYISFPQSTVSDMMGLNVFSVSEEQVNVFVNDSTSPRLSLFGEIDLNLGTVTLEFSEVIDFITFQPEYITLQNLFEPPHRQLNLTGGEPTQITLSSVLVSLTMSDLYNLKRDSDICTYRGNCYITATPDLVLDIAGNVFAGVPLLEPGIIVRMFVSDSVRPQLRGFDLDLDSNQLKLVFDEPIAIESLDITGFTLQSQSTVALSSEKYTLMDGNVYSLDAVTIMVNLSQDDANAIKARSFGTDESNTFLSIAEAAVYDLASSENAIAAMAIGEQVQTFTPDTTPPVLQGFTLNLHSDVLTLTFSEPVRVSTFNISNITIKSNCTAGSNFTLTGGTFSPDNIQDGVTEVTIALSEDDLIAIKSNIALATNTDNTFLELPGMTVEDMALQNIEFVECAPTVIVTPDSVRLMVTDFDIDMFSGGFTLLFSDVVDAHTWNPRAIRFQSNETAVDGMTYRLTSGSTSSSSNGYVIAVDLSDLDLLGLKSTFNLATTEDNTYITVQASAIDDTLGNDVLAITDTKAIKVRNFYADEIPPSLTFSALDLDTGYLNLTFDDFPNASTFLFDQVQLHNRGLVTPLALSPTELLVSSDGFTLSLLLNITDLNRIKLLRNLASDASSAYISISSLALEDFAGNSVIEIPMSGNQLIDNYTADQTGPEVVQYSLDVNASYLVLTFSETVDASSINLTAITFQDTDNITNAKGAYRLTNGMASTADGVEVSITFSEADILGLQQQSTVARDVSSTYLAFEPTLIMDTNANHAMEISQFSAFGITMDNFNPDVTRPLLQRFEFDLDEGVILLTFSKTINVGAIDYTQITLQNQTNGAHEGGFVSLSEGTVDHSNSHIVEIQLIFSNLNAIKTLTTLAFSRTSTYISFSELAFTDTRDLSIVSIDHNEATVAVGYTTDQQNPRLLRHSFDLDSGFLTLNFSESVQQSTLDITGITFASDMSMTETVNLQYIPMVVNTYEYDSTLEILIRNEDLNRIKVNENLGALGSDTFIALAEDTVDDYVGLGNSEHAASIVDAYIPDTTGPVLEDFVIEPASGQIALTFSEAVQLSSFVVQHTEIFSRVNMSSYHLTNSTPFQMVDGGENAISPNVIEITLGPPDLMEITNLAIPDTTVLTILNASVTDYNGNALQPIGDIMGGGGLVDTFSPQIVFVSFNADTGRLSITFTEPVNVATFNVSLVSLRSSMSSGAEVFHLTSGLQSTTTSSTMTIDLPTEDLNVIKAIPEFGTERSNTFVFLQSGAASDLSGNPTEVLERQVSLFTPDRTPPLLEEWEIDLGYGNISLTFDEPVLIADFNPQTITMVSSTENSAESIVLTGGEIVTTGYASQIIEVSLETDDINAIYEDINFCTIIQNCYLSTQGSAVNDVFGNGLDEIVLENAINTSNIAIDKVRPTINAFIELDVTDATLTLSFSETVNASSLNVTALTLQNSYSSSASRFDSFTLTGGTTIGPNAAQIVINITTDDLNIIKAKSGGSGSLCAGQLTCFIRADAGLISDMSNNPSNALLDPDPPIPSLVGGLENYRPDTIPPSLVNYTIDLTNGTLHLTFDETVDHDSFRSDFITIQGESNTMEGIILDPIQLRLITTEYSTVIEFMLSENDLVRLKADTDIATSLNDTFLSLTGNTVHDISILDVTAIENSKALPAGGYIQDSISPQLVTFTLLDMNEGSMTLEFNEPVLPENVNFTGITIQSRSSGEGSNVTLTGGFAAIGDQSTNLVITFSPEDIRDIKVKDNLGRDIINSYISFTSEAFADAAGNPIEAKIVGVRADRYISDTSRAMLLSYDIDG